MTEKQFQEVVAMNEDKIFGQFISIVSVTIPNKYDLVEEYRNLGIVKVSTFQTHLFKKSYLDIINTSTGVINAGIEVKAKRESQYNSLALHGFCSELKSKPDNKYIVVKFKGENDALVKYIDPTGKEYDSALILKEKKESVREQVIATLTGDEKPSIRNFKIESIYSLAIAGEKFVDDALSDTVKKAGL